MTEISSEETLDERASALVDGEMNAEQRRLWDKTLREDRGLRSEFKNFEQVVTGLRRLPPVEAPGDFLKAVQSRIRRRSRGRYFAWQSRFRFPYEAVVNGILLGLMVVVYMLGMPSDWQVPEPVSPESITNSTKAAGLAPSILAFYGEATVVDSDGDGVTYQVIVPEAEVDALLTEVSLFPQMQVLGHGEKRADTSVAITVVVR